jgi:hypothetical protein
MLGLTLLCVTSWAFSILFGSVGVFCVYFSFSSPSAAAHAVIFLGMATALVWGAASD